MKILSPWAYLIRKMTWPNLASIRSKVSWPCWLRNRVYIHYLQRFLLQGGVPDSNDDKNIKRALMKNLFKTKIWCHKSSEPTSILLYVPFQWTNGKSVSSKPIKLLLEVLGNTILRWKNKANFPSRLWIKMYNLTILDYLWVY